MHGTYTGNVNLCFIYPFVIANKLYSKKPSSTSKIIYCHHLIFITACFGPNFSCDWLYCCHVIYKILSLPCLSTAVTCSKYPLDRGPVVPQLNTYGRSRFSLLPFCCTRNIFRGCASKGPSYNMNHSLATRAVAIIFTIPGMCLYDVQNILTLYCPLQRTG